MPTNRLYHALSGSREENGYSTDGKAPSQPRTRGTMLETHSLDSSRELSVSEHVAGGDVHEIFTDGKNDHAADGQRSLSSVSSLYHRGIRASKADEVAGGASGMILISGLSLSIPLRKLSRTWTPSSSLPTIQSAQRPMDLRRPLQLLATHN